jgi:sarcosine oxidase subunit alpha
MRMGFVGELSYEIHVPTSYGVQLWESLMRAGESHQIYPFGVGAQRLLRLEKGHVLIGHDTDGMSHPAEVNLQWALDKQKPYFLGQRSVGIMMTQNSSRQLVAFTLPVGAAKPEEGHLVLDGDEISGTVTSCAFSPSLEQIIGLAYVATSQSQIGALLSIRVDDGQIVKAEVVVRPFYDAEQQRQQVHAA